MMLFMHCLMPYIILTNPTDMLDLLLTDVMINVMAEFRVNSDFDYVSSIITVNNNLYT